MVNEVFNDETEFSQTERKRLISEITEQGIKLTRAIELLLSDANDSADYKAVNLNRNFWD